MSRLTTIITTDDITGEPGAQTVQFSLDGIAYEIDLVTDQPLRDALAPFITHARRVRTKSTRRRSGDAAAVRAWARDNGYALGVRGRLPLAVLHAYARRNAE